jgi:hypothetical protein
MHAAPPASALLTPCAEHRPPPADPPPHMRVHARHARARRAARRLALARARCPACRPRPLFSAAPARTPDGHGLAVLRADRTEAWVAGGGTPLRFLHVAGVRVVVLRRDLIIRTAYTRYHGARPRHQVDGEDKRGRRGERQACARAEAAPFRYARACLWHIAPFACSWALNSSSCTFISI